MYVFYIKYLLHLYINIGWQCLTNISTRHSSDKPLSFVEMLLTDIITRSSVKNSIFSETYLTFLRGTQGRKSKLV